MGYHDVPADRLIMGVAAELKKSVPEVKQPSWAQFVKTGVSRERPPTQLDWWHIRAASMLRRIGRFGPIGTSKLANHYGSAKNMGHRPEMFKKASTNIIRKLLQQMEKGGLIKQGAKGVHKGRMVTPKGHSMLDKVANEIQKHMNIVIPKTPEQPADEVPVQKEAKKVKKQSKSEAA
ncbi:MAG: 30S ribosomal protein S19e [Nanoarchaeota archaeon]